MPDLHPGWDGTCALFALRLVTDWLESGWNPQCLVVLLEYSGD